PESYPNWFAFENATTVNKWIDQRDTKAMTLHAWRLWAATVSPTKEQFRGTSAPVFMTWWPQEDTFSPPTANPIAPKGVHFKRPSSPTNRFASPKVKPVPADAPAPLPGSQNPVMVVVQYDNDVYAQVQANQYYSPAVMNALNNAWGS